MAKYPGEVGEKETAEDESEESLGRGFDEESVEAKPEPDEQARETAPDDGPGEGVVKEAAHGARRVWDWREVEKLSF